LAAAEILVPGISLPNQRADFSARPAAVNALHWAEEEAPV